MTAVWAHRGACDVERENTLGAFRAARIQGADGVELDVRSTADGVVVVHHDQALEDGRFVAHVDAADLPAWLPSLEEALHECRGLGVDVEVKNLPTEVGYDPEERTAAAAARMAAGLGLTGTVVVSSFSMAAIDAARAAAPGVATAWLTLAGYDQLDALGLAGDRGHAGLHPRHETVTPELVTAAHERGLAVRAWTVDDPDRIRQLAATGVDAVITNVAAVALAALGRST